MQYFKDCVECEFAILGITILLILIAILIATYKPKKRWGCSSKYWWQRK